MNQEMRKSEYREMYVYDNRATPSLIKKQRAFSIVPVLVIAIAEFMIYYENVVEAMEVHAACFLGYLCHVIYKERGKFRNLPGSILLSVLALVKSHASIL
jgi:hypothetical protein